MGLPTFLETMPICEVRHGRIYMAFDDFQLVLPIEAWHRNVALGNEAIAKWHAVQHGEVVWLPCH